MSTNDDSPVRWRRLGVSVYGPLVLSQMGLGAAIPLIALSALDMGAAFELSALITGLPAIAQFIGDLPAGWVATKLGERRAIMAGCLWNSAFFVVLCFADSLTLLVVAVFALGLSGSVFNLARQTYLTEAIPVAFRARAMSTQGGAMRVGQFLGPLGGSVVVTWFGLVAAFAFAGILSLIALAATALLPDLPSSKQGLSNTGDQEPPLIVVLKQKRKVYATLGMGMMVMTLVRTARQVGLPLWCAALGFDASATSLVYAASMAAGLSLFFVGGSIMDRFGRIWVAVPSMIVMAGGFCLLPMAQTIWPIIAVGVLLGFGDGVGSGVVSTVGSDCSPAIGRTQFLSGWRFIADGGQLLAPVAVSGITAVATLGIAILAIGGLSGVGAVWLFYWMKQKPAQIGD